MAAICAYFVLVCPEHFTSLIRNKNSKLSHVLFLLVTDRRHARCPPKTNRDHQLPGSRACKSDDMSSTAQLLFDLRCQLRQRKWFLEEREFGIRLQCVFEGIIGIARHEDEFQVGTVPAQDLQ
jgi:hypothetical protein